MPGSKFTPACDVYSYATVCYEIATRKTPWKDANPAMIAVWVGTQGTRETIPDEVPASFKQLIVSCWQQGWWCFLE